jgi:hypothetical protein
MPAKVGPSFAKTVILPQEKDSKVSLNEKPKIEFELKSAGESSEKTSDFMSIMNKEKESKQLREVPVEKTIRDDNVYLQVSFGFFFNKFTLYFLRFNIFYKI